MIEIFTECALQHLEVATPSITLLADSNFVLSSSDTGFFVFGVGFVLVDEMVHFGKLKCTNLTGHVFIDRIALKAVYEIAVLKK